MSRISFKIIVVGSHGVGKTSLLWAYSFKEYPEYIPSTGFDGTSGLPAIVDGLTYNLYLWDTDGTLNDSYFTRIRPLIYPQTDVFLLCFSMISSRTFNDVKETWAPELKHHMPHTPILLCGTKADLRGNEEILSALKQKGEKVIETEEGQRLAREIGAVGYVEVSSVLYKNVEETFTACVNAALHVPVKTNKCSVM